MTRCRKDWTETENTLLRHLYAAHSGEDCAKILGRTRYSVRGQVIKLGLYKDPRVSGRLRANRRTAQVDAKASGYLQSIAPEKPVVKPSVAMRGVWFEDVVLKRGTPVCGNRMRRRVEHAT